MSQIGKAGSRRGQTSYILSIIGVSLVLVLLGFLGWMGINYSKLSDYFKESVPVRVYLRETITEKDRNTLMILSQDLPYIKSAAYKDKESARKEWMAMGNEDFMQFIDTNLLPLSIEINLKSQYVVADTLKKIEALYMQYPFVTDVTYPKNVVGNMSMMRKAGMVLLAAALLLALLVIVLIDNTIRLAMFSNRFLIKTMQMVGATRWFIARPMNIRAVINGAIAAAIAIAICWILLLTAEGIIPELKTLRDGKLFLMLCALLMVLGVSISFFSTQRSVVKYLKMKLDDLY